MEQVILTSNATEFTNINWVTIRTRIIQELYLLDAVGSSGILKGKQKLGVTFNFDKQDVIDFTKFSKMTMCRASEANS